MKNNTLNKVVLLSFSLAFWLLLWEFSAIIVDNQYFLPDITSTVKSLFELLGKSRFYIAMLLSLLRVILGILLGTILGILLAVLSRKFVIINAIISPMMSIIKSTPVATFIIILWVAVDGRILPVIIALMMVMPIIWQNLIDGFSSISVELSEVCEVFEFSFLKKIKLLIFPTLIRFLIPALVTASGLAWKSEIAAEIIAYTKNSIGQYINDSKYEYETADVFALTSVVIFLSIVIEKITKFVLRRFTK